MKYNQKYRKDLETMEWIDRLNASLNYIEEHLTEEIRIEELARIACCSSYHYQRMFTYLSLIHIFEKRCLFKASAAMPRRSIGGLR